MASASNARDSFGALVGDIVESFPVDSEGRTSISDFGKLLFNEGQTSTSAPVDTKSHSKEDANVILSKRNRPMGGGFEEKGKSAIAPTIHTMSAAERPTSRVRIHATDSLALQGYNVKPKGKAPPKRWSAEEDAALRAAVKEHGERNWKAIAEKVPGRNHTQCLQRWTKVLAPGLVKGHWRPEEDEMLKKLVAEGRKNWGQVAARVPGRTSKQCRERWFNHLDPDINRGEYSPEEDRIILEAQARLGNRWSAIAGMLPGRTEDAVKIRWKSLCRTRNGFQRNQQRMQNANSIPQQTNSVMHPSPAASFAQQLYAAQPSHVQMHVPPSHSQIQTHQMQNTMKQDPSLTYAQGYSTNPSGPSMVNGRANELYTNTVNYPTYSNSSQDPPRMMGMNSIPPAPTSVNSHPHSSTSSSYASNVHMMHRQEELERHKMQFATQEAQLQQILKMESPNTNAHISVSANPNANVNTNTNANANTLVNPTISTSIPFNPAAAFVRSLPTSSKSISQQPPQPHSAAQSHMQQSAVSSASFNPALAFALKQSYAKPTNSTSLASSSTANPSSTSTSSTEAARASAMRRLRLNQSTNSSGTDTNASTMRISGTVTPSTGQQVSTTMGAATAAPSMNVRSSLDGFLTALGDVGRISDIEIEENILGMEGSGNGQSMEELWRMSNDMNRLSL